MLETAGLPDNIAGLKAMLIAAEVRNQRQDERIAQIEKLLAAFSQAALGRRSEKNDSDRFELALEDMETAIAAVHAEDRAPSRPGKPGSINRGTLPRRIERSSSPRV